MRRSAIEAFVRVVQDGSIHKAATNLGITQPTVTKALQQLEAELGVVLLNRGTRGITLTDAGRRFHAHALVILSEFRRAWEDAQQTSRAMVGEVSVNLAPAAVSGVGPVAITEFQKKYPDIKLNIRESLPPYAVDGLRDGSTDMTVVPMNAELSRREFEIARLLSLPMVILTRRGGCYEKVRTMKDLTAAKWVRLGINHGRSVFLDRAFEENGLKAPANYLNCQSIATAAAIVATDDYCVMMPKNFIEDSGLKHQMIEIPVVDKLPVNNLVLIRQNDRPLTRAAELFWEELKSAASKIVAGKTSGKSQREDS
jgi:DNA-binding transcriptional LysR family regulator